MTRRFHFVARTVTVALMAASLTMFARVRQAEAFYCSPSFDGGCVIQGDGCTATNAESICNWNGGNNCHQQGWDCVYWPFSGCSVYAVHLTVYCYLGY